MTYDIEKTGVHSDTGNTAETRFCDIAAPSFQRGFLMASIFIIDDDPNICKLICRIAESSGNTANSAQTLNRGIQEVGNNNYDVVFLDVNMPDGDGLTYLPTIRQLDSPPEVVIITGMGDANGAETAIKNGAWDYLQKPFYTKDVILTLNRIIQYRESRKNAEINTARILDTRGIIGSSPQLTASFNQLAQAAGTESNVLITGETGTGKELFARAIHNNSRRADGSFVVVDCAALPETLVESILFGHEKGAFTGADQQRIGLVKQADGGTLFLDEIGELPLAMQKSFLRLLQEKRFRPIGSPKEETSDFRLVAATNRDLEQMVKNGHFRQDLLYRISILSIVLPPLRQREGDLPELVVHFTTKTCQKNSINIKGFSPDFIEILSTYSWPGNIRELINTVESAVNEALDESILFPKHLPERIRIRLAQNSVERKTAPVYDSHVPTRTKQPALEPFKNFRDDVVSEAEKNYFQQLMKQTQGSIKEACQISGLGRTRLYTLLKKHSISRYGWASEQQPDHTR